MNETDRELLEWAAKAAGLRLVPGDVSGEPAILIPETNRSVAMFQSWNPLTDDGDALRLAVRLANKLPFVINIQELGCLVSDCGLSDAYESNKNNDDPYAATRRAIVRAAAEIGKAMK